MSRTGASRAVLSLAELGLIQPLVSRQVLDEVERNLRLKLPAALPMLAELLDYVSLEIGDDPPPEAFARWLGIIEEKDAPILEAAVALKADYLLTLNTKHFTPTVAVAAGLKIQTPAAFIDHIRQVLGQHL